MEHILDQLLNWNNLSKRRKKIVLINLLKFQDREVIVSHLPESLIYDIHTFVRKNKISYSFAYLYTLFDYKLTVIRSWELLSSQLRILSLKRLARRKDWRDIVSKVSLPSQREILNSCYLIENTSYIIPILKMFSKSLEFKHLVYVSEVATIKDLKEFVKIPTVREGFSDQFFQYDVLSQFPYLKLKFLLKQIPEIHSNLAGYLVSNQYFDLILENCSRLTLESLKCIVQSLSHNNSSFIKDLLTRISGEKLKCLLDDEESLIEIAECFKHNLKHEYKSLVLSLVRSLKSNDKIRDL